MDKLGIYIPTYNRARELKSSLSYFMPQARKYNLPIYVSDNNSSDNTESVLRSMKLRYHKIYYKKNNTGIGNTYASNLISVLSMGKTEFAWICGDDDVIKEGAIGKILKSLRGNDFLQINSEIWDNSLSKILLSRKINQSKDIEYKKGEHECVLLNATGGYAGFMSEIITRKRYIDAVLKKEMRFGKNISSKEFIHVKLFFNSIVDKKGMLISEPLIRYRSMNTFKGGELETWLLSFPAALKELHGHYSAIAINSIASLPAYSIIGITAVNKMQNPQNVKKYKQLIRSNRAMHLWLKELLLIIMYMPNPIIRMIIWPIMHKNSFIIAGNAKTNNRSQSYSIRMQQNRDTITKTLNILKHASLKGAIKTAMAYLKVKYVKSKVKKSLLPANPSNARITGNDILLTTFKMHYDGKLINISGYRFWETFLAFKEVFIEKEYGWLKVKGKQVLDIGAFNGDTAIFFAKCGAKAIYAYEANPHLISLIKYNLKANACNKTIKIFNNMLSNKSSEKSNMYVDAQNMVSTYSEEQIRGVMLNIPSVSLDVVSKRHNIHGGILKMDIEGAEYDVIKAAQGETLCRFSQIQIDCHSRRGKSINDIVRKLSNAGFECQYTPQGTMGGGYITATNGK